MAKFKRRDEDDEEQEQPERKRRFNWNKPVVEDDEDDVPGPRKKKPADAEEDDLELSVSTGNIVLDIILDFRDDCYYWSKDHLGLAVTIGIFLFLLCTALTVLTIRYTIKYVNRPTIQTVISSYDSVLTVKR